MYYKFHSITWTKNPTTKLQKLHCYGDNIKVNDFINIKYVILKD